MLGIGLNADAFTLMCRFLNVGYNSLHGALPSALFTLTRLQYVLPMWMW